MLFLTLFPGNLIQGKHNGTLIQGREKLEQTRNNNLWETRPRQEGPPGEFDESYTDYTRDPECRTASLHDFRLDNQRSHPLRPIWTNLDRFDKLTFGITKTKQTLLSLSSDVVAKSSGSRHQHGEAITMSLVPLLALFVNVGQVMQARSPTQGRDGWMVVAVI